MMRLLPVCLLLSTLGGCSRTEILVGVATDLDVPSQLDLVSFRASRDGVELFEQDWPISGVAGRDFELPGSFGVFTNDGSEPVVEIEVSGFRNNNVVLTRDSTVTLASGRTLFLRMALEQRCLAVMCATGQTCVDGKCQAPLVTTASLPDYTDGMEKSVTCANGSTFVDTSLKTQLPTAGAGTCAANQLCIENTCYLVAAP